jgi:4-carboxymuconolactone decarboxylase
MARLPYLSTKDLGERERIRVETAARPMPGVGRAFQALLHSPELAARYLHLTNYFREASVLDLKMREMVTLATAREWNSQFIWTAHENAARQAGVPEKVILAIRDLNMKPDLSLDDTTILKYVQELLRNRKISDSTFGQVEKIVGMQGIVELTVLIGYYTMQAHTQAALEVELEEGVTPLLPLTHPVEEMAVNKGG